jgi:hypothetical protein
VGFAYQMRLVTLLRWFLNSSHNRKEPVRHYLFEECISFGDLNFTQGLSFDVKLIFPGGICLPQVTRMALLKFGTAVSRLMFVKTS